MRVPVPKLPPLPKWAAAAIAAAAVLAGGAFVTANAVTASSAQGPAGRSDQALLDITRSINLRNIANGPVQLNLLANTPNEGPFTGAVSAEINNGGSGDVTLSVDAHA
ncbi:hypothetical protein FGW37_11020 [Streptomyces rectiverticillatus]|uniref:hypothetical protein n=1 Tax=Streptomyces rectiverticillatus TaxID=173860 RepID=UPI0015C3359A|nr:hypothetical protein [Streptomyces rectiverticillatus]QLE72064.1 hypothetical protein FGW37_11020 [Streptomyces rectiverticillatus]